METTNQEKAYFERHEQLAPFWEAVETHQLHWEKRMGRIVESIKNDMEMHRYGSVALNASRAHAYQYIHKELTQLRTGEGTMLVAASPAILQTRLNDILRYVTATKSFNEEAKEDLVDGITRLQAELIGCFDLRF